MRDSKLYYQLGYMHFDDYCQNELGIKRSQAYQYISIANKLSGDFVQSTGQIGVEKLALLASISDGEREQLMEQTDVESVTVRELKEQIKGLQAEKERLAMNVEQQESQIDDWREADERLQQKLDDARAANSQLAAELEDLRQHPLPEDKYRIAMKKHDRDMMDFREQADRDLHDERQKRWDLQEQFDDFRKKQQDIVKELERQLRKAPDKPPAVIEVVSPKAEEQIFQAYISLSEAVLSQVLSFIEGAANPLPLYDGIKALLSKYNKLALDWRYNKYGTTV